MRHRQIYCATENSTTRLDSRMDDTLALVVFFAFCGTCYCATQQCYVQWSRRRVADTPRPGGYGGYDDEDDGYDNRGYDDGGDGGGDGGGGGADDDRDVAITVAPPLYSLERYQLPRCPTQEVEVCAMCTEPMAQGDLVVRLPCMHLFHRYEEQQGDILDWVQKAKTCPVCACGATAVVASPRTETLLRELPTSLQM